MHDAVIAGLVFFFSFSVVIGDERTMLMPFFWARLAAFVVGSTVIFHLFSLNRGSWRYASIQDLLAICKAATTIVLLFVIASFLLDRGTGLPRSVRCSC